MQSTVAGVKSSAGHSKYRRTNKTQSSFVKRRILVGKWERHGQLLHGRSKGRRRARKELGATMQAPPPPSLNPARGPKGSCGATLSLCGHQGQDIPMSPPGPLGRLRKAKSQEMDQEPRGLKTEGAGGRLGEVRVGAARPAGPRPGDRELGAGASPGAEPRP